MKHFTMILLGTALTSASADPSFSEEIFTQVPGFTKISGAIAPFPLPELPASLVARLEDDVMVMDSGEKMNHDGDEEVFVHQPDESGSGGRAFRILSAIDGEWREIGSYQGTLWLRSRDSGWADLCAVSRGGGGHWTKCRWKFDPQAKEYRLTETERHNQGVITTEISNDPPPSRETAPR